MLHTTGHWNVGLPHSRLRQTEVLSSLDHTALRGGLQVGPVTTPTHRTQGRHSNLTLTSPPPDKIIPIHEETEAQRHSSGVRGASLGKGRSGCLPHCGQDSAPCPRLDSRVAPASRAAVCLPPGPRSPRGVTAGNARSPRPPVRPLTLRTQTYPVSAQTTPKPSATNEAIR